jgi:hypothetical protein
MFLFVLKTLSEIDNALRFRRLKVEWEIRL